MNKFLLMSMLLLSINTYGRNFEMCLVKCGETTGLQHIFKKHKDISKSFQTLCSDMNLENFHTFQSTINKKYTPEQWVQSIEELCDILTAKKEFSYHDCVNLCDKKHD